ncbi:MAG: putative actin patch assembly and actin polymerization protein [Bathelium mastoideum]|nr:MAG: putative actin patch assembly and actin polymerization protein [Bathelium mastoideum]
MNLAIKCILKQWVLKQRKPYTAITVQIDRLTGEQYEENDVGGVVDLIEVVRLQDSGPTEAARALRKKLKYGNVHRQLRALTILDSLIQNGGSRFQRSFADEPLLERLRIMAKDDIVDSEVRAKCNVLFRQWANAYKSTPGLQGISTLYKELPRTKRPLPQQSKVIRETEAQAETSSTPSSPASPSFTRSSHSGSFTSPNTQSASSSRPPQFPTAPAKSTSSIFKKDKKSKPKPVDLTKEKPQLLEAIASASVASTNLLNALKLVNRENSRVNEDAEVMSRFEQCKTLRRQILRYIQAVESDEWIGSLLSANDELVKALMAFEIMDKSISDDSDSEADLDMGAGAMNKPSRKDAEAALAGLNLGESPPAKPPRPGSMPMPPVPNFKPSASEDSEEELVEDLADENDPFGDQNAVKTPHVEKSGMTW